MTDEPEPLIRQDDDLARAVLERALARTVRGAAVGGLALGVLALAFLMLAGGALDARSLPQALILGYGQVVGLIVAALAAVALRRARTATGPSSVEDALDQCERVARQVSRALLALSVGAAVMSIACLTSLSPFTLTALSVVLSLAVLAQLIIVLLTLRRRLRRAAQSRWTR